MVQALLFDFEGTLVDHDLRPLPHVATALTAIASFHRADGKSLPFALVAEFDGSLKDFVKLLDKTTLRPFFEPVNKRVTLNGLQKALDRSEDCLFLTGNAPAPGVKCLRFGVDFEDWAEAPALIADMVDSKNFDNTHAALKAHLAAQGMEMTSATPSSKGDINIAGHVWRPVSVPGHDDLQDIQVAVPVEGRVRPGVKGLKAPKPKPEHVAEAQEFVRNLAEHGQIDNRPGAFRPSHAIETDAEGNRKLVRKRFSAL